MNNLERRLEGQGGCDYHYCSSKKRVPLRPRPSVLQVQRFGNFLQISYIAAININTIQCNHIVCSRNLNAVESGLATNRLRILQVLPASSCSWSASACVAIIASLSKFPVHFIGLKILLPKCAILDLPTWYCCTIARRWQLCVAHRFLLRDVVQTSEACRISNRSRRPLNL